MSHVDRVIDKYHTTPVHTAMTAFTVTKTELLNITFSVRSVWITIPVRELFRYSYRQNSYIRDVSELRVPPNLNLKLRFQKIHVIQVQCRFQIFKSLTAVTTVYEFKLRYIKSCTFTKYHDRIFFNRYTLWWFTFQHVKNSSIQSKSIQKYSLYIYK